MFFFSSNIHITLYLYNLALQMKEKKRSDGILERSYNNNNKFIDPFIHDYQSYPHGWNNNIQRDRVYRQLGQAVHNTGCKNIQENKGTNHFFVSG